MQGFFSFSQPVNSTYFEHKRHILNISSRLPDAGETQKKMGIYAPYAHIFFFFAKELTVVEYKMYVIKMELNVIKLNYT